MRGAFDASHEEKFGFDPIRTADEILRCGDEALEWLKELASGETPAEVDIQLVRAIHRRWFATTFPSDAGRERTQIVLNRKGTAAPVQGIIPGMEGACGNWKWRRERYRPDDPAEEIRFIVAESNSLTVALYDVHPFIDGNTRATWHVRNYVLMLDGLRPLVDLSDEDAYNQAWWAATPQDHTALDELIIDELAKQDR